MGKKIKRLLAQSHKQKSDKGFTLVELIIVIAIIAVLAIAAFMLLTKWLSNSRDSRRLGDLETIKKSLTIHMVDIDNIPGLLPEPTNSTGVVMIDDDGSAILWKQGTFGDTVISTLDNMQKIPLDPINDKEYTYSVTPNNKKFQVGTTLEKDDITLANSAFASTRQARVEGNFNPGIYIFEIISGGSYIAYYVPSIITLEGITQMHAGSGDQYFVLDQKLISLENTSAITYQDLIGEDVNKDISPLWTGTNLADLESKLEEMANILSGMIEGEVTEPTIATLLNQGGAGVTVNYTPPATCGGTSSGGTKDFWSINQVTAGEGQSACDSSKMNFTCNEGTWESTSGSGDIASYPYTSCVVGAATNCEAGTITGSTYNDVVYNFDAINSGASTTGTGNSSTTPEKLYEFSSHTFTNCSATGKDGPALSACTSEYDTIWDEDTAYLSMTTNGIQEWTVPETGTYNIKVAGAEGGKSTSYGGLGGKGAEIQGDFQLTKGTKLKILVGQKGIDYSADGGGGGGSFVTKIDNTPLIIAGGGGGGGSYVEGLAGTNTTSGTKDSSSVIAGGSNGSGGLGNNAAGGGGLIGNGATGSAGTQFGRSFTNGGQGGYSSYYGGFDGGFGGGASSHGAGRGGGGGGGYSGGAGYAAGVGGGGGGSYNDGTNQGFMTEKNEGHGFVIITKTSNEQVYTTEVSCNDGNISLGTENIECINGKTWNGSFCEGNSGYTFTSHTFTNCGATGRRGPYASDCLSEYSASWASDIRNFGMLNFGIQTWTVPETGTYTINVKGAQGGKSTSYGGVGGKGAQTKGDFYLTKGTKLKILVGQKGTDYSADGGGGGGSFVTKMDDSPLIIAGGGGGGGSYSNGVDGVIHTTATYDANNNIPGGTYGNGGYGNNAAGGGGLTGNGATGSAGTQFGRSFLNWGLGGYSSYYGGFDGGFGGGASSHGAGRGGGGGGGYSGGTGYAAGVGGGGGGSYNGGFNQSSQEGNNIGNGSVTITKVSNSTITCDDKTGCIDGFTTHTFTNCGKTGNYGPKLAACITAYDTNWDINTDYFNITTDGYQIWTVPETGNYNIKAVGAAGGKSTSYGGIGGKGAELQGTFQLTQGQKIKILVGQKGTDYSADGGGGGGSFVTKIDNTPLIIAGGGGGGGSYTNGVSGTIENNGTRDSSNIIAGGSNGSGGLGNNAAGGGGLTGNGATGSAGTQFGYSFTNGGKGGYSSYYGYFYGGFGGGASSHGAGRGGGGGGGYSGGAGYAAGVGGGGGGSYNDGTNKGFMAEKNSGHGYVTITKVSGTTFEGYSFTSHTFTNCDSTGRRGPYADDCIDTYNTTWGNDSRNLGMTLYGTQLWTVPETTSYTIEVAGAQGGKSNSYGGVGGKGAKLSGTFNLTKGEKIKILVGQKGTDYSADGGGGGGSFVTKIDNTPLIIAGGGGGGGSYTNGVSGTIENNGTRDSSNIIAGGSNGSGGLGNNAAGGGGLTGNGATGSAGTQFGRSFLNWGLGGYSSYYTGFDGGFGGGASTHGAGRGGGGGGGYSGGAGYAAGVGGGGGGSYNDGTNPVNQSGINEGNGYVKITKN